MSTPELSIVIVNYNLSASLRDCLDSIGRCGDRLARGVFEVVVVDNHSSEADWPVLREALRDTPVQVLQRQDNGGFGAACNDGARVAKGRLLCFLNPDTRVPTDFAEAAIGHLAATPSAIVGLRTHRGRWLDYSAGPLPNLLLECLGVLLVGRYLEAAWMRLRGRLRGGVLTVGWCMGACLFLHRDTFDALGGFDEDYFLYFEEVDLCHRLHDAGGVVIYDPDAAIEHVGGAAGRRDYASFTERFYRGKQTYFAKRHDGWRRRAGLALVRAQVRAQQLAWSLLGAGGHPRAAAKLRGLAAALAVSPSQAR